MSVGHEYMDSLKVKLPLGSMTEYLYSKGLGKKFRAPSQGSPES